MQKRAKRDMKRRGEHVWLRRGQGCAQAGGKPGGSFRIIAPVFLFVPLVPDAAEPDETSQFIKAASRP